MLLNIVVENLFQDSLMNKVKKKKKIIYIYIYITHTVACESLGTPCRICENVNNFIYCMRDHTKCMLFFI